MRTIIAHCMILTAGATNAEQGQFVGIGSDTCGVFAQDYRKDGAAVENIYFTWAQGFMSGMNGMLVNEAKGFRQLTAKSTSEQKAFIRSYCSQHPLDDYPTAVVALFRSLPVVSD